MYNYSYGNYYGEGFYEDEYQSISESLENLEDEEHCRPTIVDTVTNYDDETGEYTETKVYNCSNCSNVDCPYFYDMEC